MLKRCEDTNLVLNWEKCHFMCREGIVLGHKISKSGIEVDRAKVDVNAKLPHPTIVKGVRSFLGSGYHQKDRKPSQNNKTEHGMEKTVQNQGQSPKMPKSESILKNQQSNRSRN
ncbi:hypothetical protein Tco_1576581 [Tanacetum coccineum]